jgi:hypothetical protein
MSPPTGCFAPGALRDLCSFRSVVALLRSCPWRCRQTAQITVTAILAMDSIWPPCAFQTGEQLVSPGPIALQPAFAASIPRDKPLIFHGKCTARAQLPQLWLYKPVSRFSKIAFPKLKDLCEATRLLAAKNLSSLPMGAYNTLASASGILFLLLSPSEAIQSLGLQRNLLGAVLVVINGFILAVCDGDLVLDLCVDGYRVRYGNFLLDDTIGRLYVLNRR